MAEIILVPKTAVDPVLPGWAVISSTAVILLVSGDDVVSVAHPAVGQYRITLDPTKYPGSDYACVLSPSFESDVAILGYDRSPGPGLVDVYAITPVGASIDIEFTITVTPAAAPVP